MLALTLLLMVGRGVIVGPTPQKHAKRAEALAYSERLLAFTGLLLLSVSASGYGAIRVFRAAKEEYRRQAEENIRAMIEGALQDKAKKAEKQNEPSD